MIDSTTADRPEILQPVGEEDIVELDVRPILQDGGEPLDKIMSTIQEVRDGQVLRLRATFKPTPLFGVLGAKGWSHWIERGEGEDWIIWFYRAGDFQ